MSAELRLLGPVELLVDGERRELGPPKQRCLLAILLLETGGPVATEALIDRLWGDVPPAEPRNSLYAYLARLRKALAGTGVEVRRRSGGYAIDVGAAEVDVRRVAELAAGTGDRAAALALALDLWTGEPLAGLSGAWIDRARAGLRRQRLALLTEWAGLAAAPAVVTRLRQAVREFPLAEPLIAGFLRALHEVGRTAEALEHYRATARRLADELGAEPGPVLTAAHRDLLAARPRVHQLPAPPEGFVGRDRHLADLDALTETADEPAIVLVTGMAGVGKTALALTWAHRAAGRFPDGRLQASLRGHSADPVLPVKALAGFLHALGVAEDRIPFDEAAAAALFRSLLATRRMLVVLDDAAGVDQVRPLLPGTGGSVVVVTSRGRLSGLVVDEGARRLPLASLPDADALALLTHVLGAERVAADPAAAAELVALCGRLPLALRIAAANLLVEPHGEIARHVAELRATTPLDALGGPDAVRGAFDLSYQRLDPDQRRLFRLLSHHPGVDVTAEAAAALTGTDHAVARRLLDRLAGAHLLELGPHPRYAFHELVWQYARERARAEDDADERAAALRRLGTYYLHATDRACRVGAPALAMPTPAATGPAGLTADEALGWLDAERTNLVLLAANAENLGLPDLAWQLSALLRGYLQLRAHDGDWPRMIDAGVAAARRQDDPAAMATAAISRGYLFRMRGPAAAAVAAFEEALRQAERAGWAGGRAAALAQLGFVYPKVGKAEAGIDCLVRAIDLARADGDAATEGAAHGNLGSVCAGRGFLHRALAHLRAELDLLAVAPSPFREANALADAGLVLGQLGELTEAVDMHRRALALARAMGHRSLRANAHVNLAAGCLELGRLDEAAEQAGHAMRLAYELRADGVVAEAESVLAGIDDRRGRPEAALAGHQRAVLAARASGDSRALAEVLTRYAERATRLSDVDEALAVARRYGYRVFEARALRAAAELHLAQGLPDRAAGAASAALALCRDTGHRPGEERALATLAALQGSFKVDPER